MLHRFFLAAALSVGFAAAREQVYNLFVDDLDNQAQFKASIIGACENRTTYAIFCTSGQPMNNACSGGATVSELLLTRLAFN